ncbi:MAG: hypothetical protein U1F36_12975 [Planctomycetota bacterium]
MTRQRTILVCAIAVVALLLAASCATEPQSGNLHRWWAGLGPVLPHDTFPADCKLCHTGSDWNTLVPEFSFDHAAKTGVPLNGAHARAQCLLCHNDRGPVAQFRAQGCAGCHEDWHAGTLGQDCARCHGEETWRSGDLAAAHLHARFPLTGAHATTSCQRCHPGAFAGRFVPVDTQCATCHQDDLQRTTNPPHLGLGWIDHCDRCHIPTHWRQAQVR